MTIYCKGVSDIVGGFKVSQPIKKHLLLLMSLGNIAKDSRNTDRFAVIIIQHHN